MGEARSCDHNQSQLVVRTCAMQKSARLQSVSMVTEQDRYPVNVEQPMVAMIR